MVKATSLLMVWVASVSLPAVCDPTSVLDQVKLPEPQPRPEPLRPRQLLVAGSRLHAPPRESAEERF